MRFLAGYVMRGRMQATLVAAVAAVLSLLLPPLSYLSGGAVGLVTLRLGAIEGLAVVAGAALAASLLLVVALGTAAPGLAYVAVLWLPVWALALVLRRSVNLGLTTLWSGAAGAAVVVLLHTLLDEPSAWWADQLGRLLQGAMAAGGETAVSAEAVAAVAAYLTGIAAAGTTLSLMGTVLLARWWQALLYNAGGFRQEFHALRLPRALGAVTLALALFTVLSPQGGVARDLLLVAFALHFLQGLGLVHGMVGALKAHGGWLVALYVVLFAAFAHAALLLGIAGFVDSWVDFRRLSAKHRQSDA